VLVLRLRSNSTQALYADILRIPGFVRAIVCLLTLRGSEFRRQTQVAGSRRDVFPSGERRDWVLPSSRHTSPIVVRAIRSSEPRHAGASGVRRRAMSDRISWHV
jgi:hypothetical protein